MEIWHEIPEYTGLYEASSNGRIRSVEGKITSSARFKKRVWKQRIIKQKIERQLERIRKEQEIETNKTARS